MARRVAAGVAAWLAAWIALSAGPAARADSVTLTAPRAFGYVIGDTLTLDADIRLDPGARLDPASLPRPHSVSSTLDLVAVHLMPLPLDGAAPRYRLQLTYQNFFGALEPRTLDIPPWPLTVRDGAARRELLVPGFAFVATPLRELVSSRGGNPLALQPDIPPAPIPLSPLAARTGLAATLALFALLALALVRGWRPFRRAVRPFAQAERAIRRDGTGDRDSYRAALLALHRAFDASAGRRLLSDDVGAFLAQDRRFAGLAGEIDAVFAASRIAFFGAGLDAARAQLSADRLRAIARRLTRAERRAPPPHPAMPEAAT
ncbi:nonribosomal peptide synthetase MxaA [Xanthobacter sp. V4C-4]|uniref:nonribosomal peptide synthetase MxaA n=1 Tax=Xanthobacter cornucopiae TaxID=3119924 RepID=UPI00372ADEFE